MNRLTLLLTLPLVLMTRATPLEAQDARRGGFWIGFGVGAGWNTSLGLDGERRAGFSGYLRLGGTVNANVLLGFETMGWARSDDDLTVVRGNVTFSTLLYPSATGGFFIKPGVGFSSLENSVDLGNGRRITESQTGFGGTLGIGHDIELGRISLVAGADWLFQLFDAGENLATTNTLLLITLGVTWH